MLTWVVEEMGEPSKISSSSKTAGFLLRPCYCYLFLLAPPIHVAVGSIAGFEKAIVIESLEVA